MIFESAANQFSLTISEWTWAVSGDKSTRPFVIGFVDDFGDDIDSVFINNF
jgi:hypothetical protein